MPLVIASALVFPVAWAHVMLTPLRKIFLGLSGRIIRLFGIRSAPPSVVNEKDFLTLVEVGAESGSLDRDEKELIFNVFSFGDLSVSMVMTPWSKVFSVPDSITVPELLERVRHKTFSRVPVVSQDNRVVAILYRKELLKLLLNPPEAVGLDLLRDAM